MCEMTAHLPVNITEHTAASLDGVPVFCGGFSFPNSRQFRCFKFSLKDNAWQEVKMFSTNI